MGDYGGSYLSRDNGFYDVIPLCDAVAATWRRQRRRKLRWGAGEAQTRIKTADAIESDSIAISAAWGDVSRPTRPTTPRPRYPFPVTGAPHPRRPVPARSERVLAAPSSRRRRVRAVYRRTCAVSARRGSLRYMIVSG